jgi:hypothetical protein
MNKTKLRNTLMELNLQLESAASDEAKRQGLTYMSFGRWGKDGRVTHLTKGGKLTPISQPEREKLRTEPSNPDQLIGTGARVNPAPERILPKLQVGNNHYHIKKKHAAALLPGTLKTLMTQHPDMHVQVIPGDKGFDIKLEPKTGKQGGGLSIDVGSLSITPGNRTVTVDNTQVKLSKTESKLLTHLATNQGKAVDTRTLLTKVFDVAPDVDSRVADMTISRLKKRLGAAGNLIQKVRGLGYRLDNPNKGT